MCKSDFFKVLHKTLDKTLLKHCGAIIFAVILIQFYIVSNSSLLQFCVRYHRNSPEFVIMSLLFLLMMLLQSPAPYIIVVLAHFVFYSVGKLSGHRICILCMVLAMGHTPLTSGAYIVVEDRGVPLPAMVLENLFLKYFLWITSFIYLGLSHT